jgi:hypothetical protein
LATLDEAGRYTDEREDHLTLIREARRRVEQAWKTWKKDRAKRIEQALADETQPVPDDIEVWIEEFWARVPKGEEQVKDWLTRVSARRRLDAAVQAAEAIRPELEALWAECEQAITANEIVAAADAANKALNQVRDLQREYPEAALVLRFVEEAESWRTRALGPLATAAQMANFEHLLEKYEELKAKGHDLLPRFRAVRAAGRLRFTADEQGGDILELEPGWEEELLPAGNAIWEIEALATEYACRKAE